MTTSTPLPQSAPRSASLVGPFLVLGGALCFSSSGFTQALLAPYGASPLLIAGMRIIISALALYLWCAFKGLLPARGTWSEWPVIPVLLSAGGILSYQLLFFTGTMQAGVAVGTVLTMGFTPLCTALLGWIVLHEKPLPAWYPATLLAITGLVLMNWTDAGDVNFVAVLPSLGAGMSYAVYIIACKPLAQKHAPETVTMVLFILCALAVLPLLWNQSFALLFTWQGAVGALHLGVFTAAVGYCLTLAGLKTTPAAAASTLGLAEPLCAALLGFFCLGEPMVLGSLVGMACILGGACLLIFCPNLGGAFSRHKREALSGVL